MCRSSDVDAGVCVCVHKYEFMAMAMHGCVFVQLCFQIIQAPELVEPDLCSVGARVHTCRYRRITYARTHFPTELG